MVFILHPYVFGGYRRLPTLFPKSSVAIFIESTPPTHTPQCHVDLTYIKDK
jgi:hypothetical protein